jgi:hypothetical protein
MTWPEGTVLSSPPLQSLLSGNKMITQGRAYCRVEVLFIPLAVAGYFKEHNKGARTVSYPGREKGFVNQS